MLCPKNTKYIKFQKGKNKGSKNNMFINFGSFGMKAIQRGIITSNQIESSRRVITKTLNKEGKIWIRMFPDQSYTKKPLEVRMGKGKGNIEYWIVKIKPGFILYEIDLVEEILAKKACFLASFKLPIKTSFIKKKIFERK